MSYFIDVADIPKTDAVVGAIAVTQLCDGSSSERTETKILSWSRQDCLVVESSSG